MSGLAQWWLALGLGLVVAGVVWLLLALILGSARRIRDTVDAIWVEGPRVASNTAHLDLLRRIRQETGRLIDVAGRIDAEADRVLAHARGCSGCPRCVTGWGDRAAPESPTGGRP